MVRVELHRPASLSVIVPCYNEAATIENCVQAILDIADGQLTLEIIIVDDKSTDDSLARIESLARSHPEIKVLRHERNRGKGAAIRTGIAAVTGEIAAIQDADLEYNPQEIRKLMNPILAGLADVVYGSRFLSCEERRILYFWHTMTNKLLTLLSNMFTDLCLTDMETCYKIFRSDYLKQIELKEDRFGIEPEITAKIAQMRLRIYEIGVSYHGRTYQEGKKIGWRDGFRALYCIFRYNAHCAPLPMQFLIYLFIGGTAGVANLLLFLLFLAAGMGVASSTVVSYLLAAALNYVMCIYLLFRHKARWDTPMEVFTYLVVVALGGILDLTLTQGVLAMGTAPWLAKSFASILVLVFNFAGRKYLVFPEKAKV